MQRNEQSAEYFNASGYRVGIAAAQFNREITDALLEAALAELGHFKVPAANMDVVRVPGSVELPLALQIMAKSKKYDCLVALGAVIKGETPHFEYVCKMASEGVLRVMLDHAIPVGFGVLTVLNEEQARARIASGGKGAVRAAMELAAFKRRAS